MSRYVCGSHELKSNASIVPPKELGGRSWSGDGRRPSGALHSTGFGSLDRACGSSSSSSSSKVCVAPLALVELACSKLL
ncbi:unnamed protein product [Microthlaspi erraticum]|uniref:Uncharacterized protein n=1 Tax=Microthlaspi erraticum TaxID=1685480 RepID=A0A6D2J325_9BRAS|nr:unnamed protein product [Microthlaspi erraticum]